MHDKRKAKYGREIPFMGVLSEKLIIQVFRSTFIMEGVKRPRWLIATCSERKNISFRMEVKFGIKRKENLSTD